MNLFTYGTLMDPDIMKRVSGNHYKPMDAALPGFRRRRIINEMFPGIAPDAEETTAGVLYRNISPASLHRLDLFEGDLYKRQTIQIQLNDGSFMAADSYVVKAEYHHRLSKEAWTMEWFLLNGKSRFHAGYDGFNRV